MEHGGTIYLGMISDIYKDHKNLRNIFTKLVLSIRDHRWFGIDQDYDLEKCYHLGKKKSLPMPLAKERLAKKIWTTPRTKNCISSSSNLTGIINVLKIGGRIFF